jgi:kynureninase
MKYDLSRQEAQRLDEQDPLHSYRQAFVDTEPELIYLLGNSLGRLPETTARRMSNVVQTEWGERLIRGWMEGWMELPQRIGDKIGSLLGARPGEVIVADSTSVNFYKAVLAALQLAPGRSKVITDDLNFPSDLYILQGALRAAGGNHRLHVVPSPDGIHGPLAALLEAIDEETALVALSHTIFKSAYVYDMAAVNRVARQAGARVVWDLSHSAGAVSVDLNAAQAEFAVGCTYKYLNGGPGAPAFLYVRRGLQPSVQNPISGWMGQQEPFEFGLEYEAASGMRRFLTGTPAILSLSAIEPGIELLLEAGMQQVVDKSRRQTAYLQQLWQEHLQPLGFALQSPQQPERRGSHLALAHEEGLRISLALKERNVLLDFRRPDNLRLSVAPLYTSYVELYDAVQHLRTVVSERLYEKYPLSAPAVT